MKILAIETSCDDTGIAILDIEKGKNPSFNVLSNVVASQIDVHQKYGGVHPGLAKREHEKNLTPTLEVALTQAKISLKDIDLIAVTNGPGLEPCLWVGVSFAKDLAKKLGTPLVPINHIEAHILINLLNNPKTNFPAIALVVSGGHTQIILVKRIGSYKILGETRDDAAGECFDKCAKILGLGYPGGPIISKLAEKIETKKLLPRPMIGTKDYDFSFSGLKTAVLYADREVKNKNLEYKKMMASEIQQAIIDVLIKKTIKATKDYKAKTIILGGGVTANLELRKQFNIAVKNMNNSTERLLGVELFVPQANLSTDNGLMVAVAAYFRFKNKKFTNWKNLKADPNLRVE